MGFTLPDFHLRTVVNGCVRLCQLVGALVVCVYYGSILDKALKNNVYGDPKWIFATTVGGISGATALVYLLWNFFLEFRAFSVLFAWDTVVAILWIVCSGVFGNMYLKEKAEMDEGIKRMKVAEGFDLANMLLWMGTAAWCSWVVFVSRQDLLLEGRQKYTPKGGESGEKARSTHR